MKMLVRGHTTLDQALSACGPDYHSEIREYTKCPSCSPSLTQSWTKVWEELHRLRHSSVSEGDWQATLKGLKILY